MIGPTGMVRVMMATKPVDFRKGAEGLAALVRETMKSDPFSGAVYVFRAKRADRVKLIYWDGTGVCLFAKRLEDGQFRWPNVQDGVMRLSAAEFSALLEGLDWKRVHAAREMHAPSVRGGHQAFPAPIARLALRAWLHTFTVSPRTSRGTCTKAERAGELIFLLFKQDLERRERKRGRPCWRRRTTRIYTSAWAR